MNCCLQNYEGESSYEERWEDMLSILDLQSVLEGDSMSEVGSDWDNFTSPHNALSTTLSSALVQNVSMTLPIASTSVILSRHGKQVAWRCSSKALDLQLIGCGFNSHRDKAA